MTKFQPGEAETEGLLKERDGQKRDDGDISFQLRPRLLMLTWTPNNNPDY